MVRILLIPVSLTLHTVSVDMWIFGVNIASGAFNITDYEGRYRELNRKFFSVDFRQDWEIG